jgi:seryl-tRNA synthetase
VTVEIEVSESDGELAYDPDDRFGTFRDRLIGAGLLLDAGEPGLYLRSDTFERICRSIDALVTSEGGGETVASYHFPLVMARSLLEQTDYIRSFPNLVGVISSFEGGGERHAELLAAVDDGREWADVFGPTPLALCSAACHPLYRTITEPIRPGGVVYEVIGQCFRREPSLDPARMQVFRQHEFVFVGEPEGARAHRDDWIARGLQIHRRLGLEIDAVIANDPFFGRAGQLLAQNQFSDGLKTELISPITSTEAPTAITSANCHLDHFGVAFGISTTDGGVAHSACVGFGIERIALALLATHGLDPGSWPSAVRVELRWG